MAIFAILQTEKIVQVGDKTRLDASSSFVSDGAEITLIEIQPTEDDQFIAVNLTRPYLDWVYVSDGDFTASVRVTTASSNSLGPAEILVKSESDDSLFSGDSDIVNLEPSVKSLLPDGKSSFLNVHREAQSRIMQEINDKNLADSWITPSQVADKREVKEWSKYLTLQIIFEGSVNATDDVFFKKAQKYEALSKAASNRSFLALDLNNDGVISEEEKKTGIGSVPVVRR